VNVSYDFRAAVLWRSRRATSAHVRAHTHTHTSLSITYHLAATHSIACRPPSQCVAPHRSSYTMMHLCLQNLSGTKVLGLNQLHHCCANRPRHLSLFSIARLQMRVWDMYARLRSLLQLSLKRLPPPYLCASIFCCSISARSRTCSPTNTSTLAAGEERSTTRLVEVAPPRLPPLLLFTSQSLRP